MATDYVTREENLLEALGKDSASVIKKNLIVETFNF